MTPNTHIVHLHDLCQMASQGGMPNSFCNGNSCEEYTTAARKADVALLDNGMSQQSELPSTATCQDQQKHHKTSELAQFQVHAWKES